ncbi:hypothetical protein DKX38_022973 [Salix brachista]|uniref:Uncharacterized protein n=1 Tax=Salix brachista TaxID=2182728 RepID=A0A5N5K412_9ROSI|nr:hypothetical protein DKX38_022973 [Salix brachista]
MQYKVMHLLGKCADYGIEYEKLGSKVPIWRNIALLHGFTELAFGGQREAYSKSGNEHLNVFPLVQGPKYEKVAEQIAKSLAAAGFSYKIDVTGMCQSEYVNQCCGVEKSFYGFEVSPEENEMPERWTQLHLLQSERRTAKLRSMLMWRKHQV